VEQPLPADMVDAYKYLKKESPLPIMGDESVLNQPKFDELVQQFDMVNMKLMKAGGYINGIRILKEAKARGLRTMIGCMVETTLGIKSAWSLCSLAEFADLDGCLIISNEPYHLLKEENGQFLAS
jgi:L-alanine-DL-glutamate epimerase-like enolase superfamily enzyme